MATTDLERLVVSLEANIKKFEREMSRSRQSTDTAMRGVERRTQQATQRIEGMMTRAGRTINTALSGMLAGLSVQQVSQFADSYTKVQNALKVAGLEGQKLAGTYNELFAIAQRHGAPLESMATLYGRVSLAQKDLNATSAQVMSLTNNVALALRVASADASTTSSTILQLSQALSGGKVQWEDYEPMLDTAQPLLRAVAAGMEETGGSVTKLSALVKDGKVSSEGFFRAFEAGAPLLEKMAQNTAPTLSQGMERVNNALTDIAGKMNEAAGATKTVQDAINWLIEDLGKVPAAFQSTIDEINRIIDAYERLKRIMGIVSQSAVPYSANEDGTPAQPLLVRVPGKKKPPAGAAGDKPVNPIRNSDYGVPDDGKGKKGRKERENDLQREIKQIQERTRALDAERLTIGMSAGDTAKAEAAFRLLEAAKEANVAVTPQLKAQIDSLAAAYGEATQKVEDAQKAQEAVTDAAQEVGAMLSNAFQDAILEGEELDQVLQKLAKSLASKAFDNIFSNLLGGTGGQGGGLLDGIFKSLFAPGKAGGGMVNAGQPYTVGESGRELFVPTTPGRIVPNGKLGGGGMQVVINNNSGSQVSAKQTQGPQGPRLQVQIDEMVASALASGSKTGDVLKNLQRNRMGGR